MTIKSQHLLKMVQLAKPSVLIFSFNSLARQVLADSIKRVQMFYHPRRFLQRNRQLFNQASQFLDATRFIYNLRH